MSKLFKFILVLILLWMIHPQLASANNTILEDAPASIKQDSIKVIGIIYNNRTKIKNYTISIYQRNKLLKTITGSSRKNFQSNVPVNTYCTIEIIADGYYTKRFIFDTSIPNDYNKQIPEFKFDMDVFSEKELDGVNTSALDLPVGVVKYNNKKERFEHNKSYTKKMKKIYKDLLIESQMQERMQLTNEKE